ncbi:MAG: peptide-N-glycosidase F-related protein, partial [Myxococcota bacterium]|nr:peptide-N-glycosidase F-related protein [Myxococcota bacterium]
AADQYFGDPNLRKIEAQVDFPESGPWFKVGMWFQLDCPESGLCDHWDRSGSVQLVLNPDAAEDEPREELELLRHITPYRMGMCQFVDVTPLANLLRGEQTLTSWIDTWVGPGHAQGEGWRVTVGFVFYPGVAAGADHVLNVWGRRNITVGEIEAEANVQSQIDPVDVLIPETASQVVAHLTTTGHSFGNSQNCAEFCQMRHDIIVDGALVESVNPWRPDCDQNPVSPQAGTWQHPRNGWCPGAAAIGHLVDLTEVVTPGQTASIDLDILMSNGTEYDNTNPVDLLPYTYVSLKLYAYE